MNGQRESSGSGRAAGDPMAAGRRAARARRAARGLDGLAVFALAVAATVAATRLPLFDRAITETRPPVLLGLVLAAAAAGAAARRRAADAPAAYRTLTRGVVGTLAFYALVAEPSAVAGLAGTDRLPWLAAGRLLALAAAAVSWWRPSVGLAVPLYVVWFRQEVGAAIGLSTGGVWDYIAVAHLALVLAALPLAERVVEPLAARFGFGSVGGAPPLATGVRLSTALFFAHYLHSGLAKLRLDGGVTAWLLDNRTHLLTDAALEMRILPLAGVGEWGPTLATALARLDRPLNLATLAIEIGCLVALVRRRWTAAAALVLVLLHLAILLTSGVFFWKWIVVEVGIAAAAVRLRPVPFPDAVRISLLAVALLAPLALPTARLGWYDTRAFQHGYLVAVTDDGGAEVRVPSNFFLSGSLQMIQMEFGYRPLERRWDLSIWGHTSRRDVMRDANDCDAPTTPTGNDENRLPRLERYVRAHHALAVERAGADGRLAYDLYPHHIWSDPSSFGPFARLDLRRIVAYRWVVERLCLPDRPAGRPRRQIERATFEIDLRDHLSAPARSRAVTELWDDR